MLEQETCWGLQQEWRTKGAVSIPLTVVATNGRRKELASKSFMAMRQSSKVKVVLIYVRSRSRLFVGCRSFGGSKSFCGAGTGREQQVFVSRGCVQRTWHRGETGPDFNQ